MYLIVVGAGPVGLKLIDIALQDGHNVTLIEADSDHAQEAAKEYDCLVLNAHISDGKLLEQAEMHRADALIATTQSDPDNLMAMFIGEENGVPSLVSVVNNQRHDKLFERLGARVLANPENIIAEYLYADIIRPNLKDLVKLPEGAEVFDITVGESSPLIGHSLSEIGKSDKLPRNLLIVMLKRDDHTSVPTGKTKIEANDELVVFSQEKVGEKILKTFTG